METKFLLQVAEDPKLQFYRKKTMKTRPHVFFYKEVLRKRKF